MISEIDILVIDDEAVIRDGCIKILTKEGWSVDTAENGHEGLEKVRSENFDIILLDLMMPGMSGLDVLSEVKNVSPNIYIIVITGYATIDTAVEAMKKGAFDYISKPFTPDQLRMVVKKVLENKALIAEREFLRREQEKGLKAIAMEKSKIKTILDCMPNGVLVVDEEKKIALLNPMAGKLLNISGSESIGREIERCINSDELSAMLYDVLEHNPGEEKRLAAEIENENSIPLMAHVSPVKMDDGNVIGAVAVLQDISAQKSIDKMKSDFIAKVTHELKTPAATINQLLMTLQSGVVGELEEDQRNMIERARLWGEGLLELVSDLLNISKFESGLAIQKLVPLNIEEIINDVIDLIKPQAEKKSVKIITNFAEELPVINADSQGMRDVFSNLLSNAVKYTRDKDEIIVDCRREKDYLKISVTDHGLGIGEKDMPFLFDRFFRVKNKETRHIMGTGLGLPIVKEIIEAHNGFMDVISEENKGSTFTVYLPEKIN